MKRTVSILLIVSMVAVLSACGGSKEEAKPAETTTAEEAAGGFAGMGNPWIDTDSDTIFSNIGFRFGEPEGATDIIYRYNDSIGLAEMQFTLNKIEWCARAQKGESAEDISGMYYEWEEDYDVYITNYNFELPGNGHKASDDNGKKMAYMGQWFYEAGKYNFSLSAVAGKDDEVNIDAVASETFPLEGAGEDDPVEYGQDYWAEKYPERNICPFYIAINGVEYNYYWATGEGGTGDIREWVDTDFNWNGWHIVDGYVVNEDETYRMTDDSMNQSFSSCCTYETEKIKK